MAWMRKKRVEVLNYIINLVKNNPKGMDEIQLLKEIMRYYWVSRTTAQRYIDDLIFIGRLTRNNNHIKVAEEKNES